MAKSSADEMKQNAERVQHSLVSSVGYYSHAFKEYTVKGRCACGWRLWVPISQVDQRWSAHIDGPKRPPTLSPEEHAKRRRPRWWVNEDEQPDGMEG